MATIISTPLLYFALIFFAVSVALYYPASKFNREKWLNDERKRYELSEDIIESKMLIGKTKAEIRQLLGKDEYNDDKSNNWSYDLGEKPDMGIDVYFLDIKFYNDTVVKVAE